MAKKIVIFLGAATAAAMVTGAIARKRRAAGQTPLLETMVGKTKRLDSDWRTSDDALSTELASVVADEAAATR